MNEPAVYETNIPSLELLGRGEVRDIYAIDDEHLGSGWKDYQRTGAVCGIGLPPDLRQADKLPQGHLHPLGQGPRSARMTRTSTSRRQRG